jgi:hypothetical protein
MMEIVIFGLSVWFLYSLIVLGKLYRITKQYNKLMANLAKTDPFINKL